MKKPIKKSRKPLANGPAIGKRSEPLERIFTLKEKRGELPYTCFWVSIDGRLCQKQFETLAELLDQENRLEALGREPVLMLNISCCEIG